MRVERVYTPDDLALFARYAPARADYRPKGCTGAAMCWVEKGPPAVNKEAVCLACGCSAMARVPRGRRGQYAR